MPTATDMETDSPKKEATKLPENRFELELEFVQALASPAYLHHLATNKTDEGQSLLLDQKFKAFLRYLQTTWSQPPYSRFITYPHSLYFLDLLIKNEAFCRELAQVGFLKFCTDQQYNAWHHRFATLFGNGEPKLVSDAAGETAASALLDPPVS